MGCHLTEWPDDLPTVTIAAEADAAVRRSSPDSNMGTATVLATDGGDRELGDSSHALAYLRFPLDVPGRPVMVKLWLHTHDGSHSNSAEAGDLRMVSGRWEEETVTYAKRPYAGEKVGEFGEVGIDEAVERLLHIDLRARDGISLAIVPTSCDAAVFSSREGEDAPQLIVAYEPE
jgi:hypothetical protein